MTREWLGIRRILRVGGGARRQAREVRDELDFHFDTRVEELVAAGATPAAAYERARREFGDRGDAELELTGIDRRRDRRTSMRTVASNAASDLRHALRGMHRAPGFTAAVVLTLGLGIGANATMFGVVDRLMLRPPPDITAPDEVRRMFQVVRGPNGFVQDSYAYADYVDLATRAPALAQVAATSQETMSLGVGADAGKVRVLIATASLFPTLGVRPVLGRFYTPDEDRPPTGARLAVLSEGFWRRQFGGDPAIIGRDVELAGKPYTVVGVAPRGFRALEKRTVDVFVPMSAVAADLTSPYWHTDRDWYWINIVARLAPGATEAQAATQATALWRARSDKPQRRPRQALLASIVPGRVPGGSPEGRVSLWLMGVAVIVVVIATANVANLLLNRAARRRREIAVRLALGVTRARLMTQLLTESVALAALGLLAAVVLTHYGSQLIRGLLLEDFATEDALLDGRVFVVSTVVALAAGLLSGLAPVWQSLRADVAAALKAGSRGGTYRRSTLRTALVVTQATLSLALITAAALFVASLRNVTALDLGYDTRHTLAVHVDLKALALDSAQRIGFYETARERLAAVPGIEAASLSQTLPFWSSWSVEVRAEGVDSMPSVPDGGPYVNVVSPQFFEALGMRIVRGRALATSDVKGAPRAAVVNESMARLVWPGSDPIGKCLYLGDHAAPRPCTTVVGVVHDARRQGIDEGTALLYYIPVAQNDVTGIDELQILSRFRGDPESIVPRVTSALRSIQPNLPYIDTRVLQDLVDPQLRPWRLGATLFGIFGAIALLVATVGLYSVVAYDTTQRTQEVGVRIALGARPGRVLGLVIGSGMKTIGAGLALGLGIVIALGGLVRPLLFEVSPRDPVLLLTSVACLLAAAIVALTLPAWRAAHIAPTEALRSE